MKSQSISKSLRICFRILQSNAACRFGIGLILFDVLFFVSSLTSILPWNDIAYYPVFSFIGCVLLGFSHFSPKKSKNE